MNMSSKHCVPCEGSTVPLLKKEAEEMLKEIPKWTLWPDGRMISREFTFKDFAQAMAFANKVAVIAEEEGHHPDLHISWGVVEIELSTHSVSGLTENDFILASKIDSLK